MARQMQMQLQIQEKAVMSHFCWAYTNALLKKLKELKAKGNLYTEHPNGFYLSTITESVLHAIRDQLNYQNQIEDYAQSPVEHEETADRFINLAEEFLAIFKKD